MMSASSSVRLIAVLLVVCLLFGSLSGCGGSRKDPDESASTTENIYYWDDAVETLPADTSSEPAETEPAEESSEPTETTGPTEPEGPEGTVTGDVLNIRSGPGTNYGICGSLKKNDRVLILEQKLVDGKLWGRTEDGWISMNYVLLDDPDEIIVTEESFKGIIMKDKLKAYEGPGSQYSVAATLNRDTRVTILATCGQWGKTESGWIDLDQIYKDGEEGPDEPVKGTVTGSHVNVRSDPSTSSEVVGAAYKDDRVEIFYQVTIGDMTWGCTKAGWICMDYVRLDGDISDEILATWYRCSAQSGKNYTFILWTFAKDGTFTVETTQVNQDDPDTHNTTSQCAGSYTSEGSTLILSFKSGGSATRISICGTTYIFPCSVPVTATVQENKLTMSVGSSSDTLTKGSLQNAIDAYIDEPEETEPTETEPTETDPTETDPTETDPTETDPTETDPTETDPTETDPTETDPTETDPTETDPTESGT